MLGYHIQPNFWKTLNHPNCIDVYDRSTPLAQNRMLNYGICRNLKYRNNVFSQYLN